MTQSIKDLLSQQDSINFAINIGQSIHQKMRHVFVNNNIWTGDDILTKKLSKHPELTRFFIENAQTEIPIAGTINGCFISRRIDRMIVNHINKTIDILDYKTDHNRNDVIREKYKKQVCEYIELMNKIYPNYTIHGFILWLHDCFLDNIF